MYRSLVALCAIFACLAVAGPAAAQAPDPDADVDVIVTCDENNMTMIRVNVTGLNPGEHAGYLGLNAEGEAVMGATATDFTDASGSHSAGFGSTWPNGTYTMYAYTGPYQNIADPSTWPGSIQVDTFHPELTTSWTSTQFEITCGPADKQECKMGGFESSGFRNQGQCVSTYARQ